MNRILKTTNEICNTIFSVINSESDCIENSIVLKRNVAIALSGACHSGKTSTINSIKAILQGMNINVVVLDEIIRKKDIESIESLRKDANAYIDMQVDIITEKIMQERAMFDKSTHAPAVYLIDRSIMDSLFYLLAYTNISQLDDAHILKMADLIDTIEAHILSDNFIYDVVFLFKPIHVEANAPLDKLRPNNINSISLIEYNVIRALQHTLNYAYSTIHVNLNAD